MVWCQLYDILEKQNYRVSEMILDSRLKKIYALIKTHNTCTTQGANPHVVNYEL